MHYGYAFAKIAAALLFSRGLILPRSPALRFASARFSDLPLP
jgi:hypothetical protein